jgi:ankyrin repeat protein
MESMGLRPICAFLLGVVLILLTGCNFFFGRSKEEVQAIEGIKQRILANPGSINVDDGSDTPLNFAARNNYLDLAEWLVAHGADGEAPNRNKETPLRVAMISDRSKDLRMMRFLLEHGGQVNTFGESDQMPLHEAAFLGRSDVALLLIQHGARVAASSFTGATPLHIATERPNNQAVAQVLLDHGAKIEARTFADETPLCRAATTARPEMVQFLLEHGADPSPPCNRGATPLHIAAAKRDSKIVALLLEHGANVHATDYDSRTPLWLATHARESAANATSPPGSDPLQIVDLIRQHGGME